jgi:hypothetical protein
MTTFWLSFNDHNGLYGIEFFENLIGRIRKGLK